MFLTVLKAFHEEGVEYLVVGGLAVILHGHARLTTDLDLVVHLTPENATRAVNVLTRLGMKPRAPVNPADFADALLRERWVEEKHLLVFSFYSPKDPLFDVDLFVKEPGPFDEWRRSSVEINLDGVPVRVCGLDHLIAMKEHAGRPRDLEDVRILKEIRHG